MPNAQQWQKIKEIVGAALERDSAQRSAFLDEACSRDSALRAEVDSLLSAYNDAGPLSQGSQTTELADGLVPLRSIGPYQLIQLLGEGGMGQVWLAEQTSPVRRKVALKLIKTGIFDESALRRFQTERQSLAIMDHPAIAKVFDAGATPDGQPYFVMEYVPGLPLTEYCDKRRLKIRERLELFIHTCEGVQHAHQKALIHRDLKPANILVVEVDGHPRPRIIDFGLAKSVTPFFGGDFGQTRVGAFVGTPAYMSPEQADPGSLDVDTRTDVYSLGVILYQLLTGSLPVDPSIWKDLRFEEMLRHLREDEPLRPSTKVTSSRDASSPLAAARGTQTNQLASLLRGDLDWITLKALDKDRNRRYGSPSDLAADLSRYLRNQPVIARPASPGYLVRKYVRRHRYAVAFASTLVLLLAGFAILQAIQLRRITRERDRADRIAAFMSNMFRISDPSAARGNSITVREVLDKASADIESSLNKDPQLQAKMMTIMGEVYHHLGLYPKAEALLKHALNTDRELLGDENPDTMAAGSGLGATLADAGNLAEAERLLRPLVEIQKRKLGRENRTTLIVMNLLASVLHGQGKFTDAEKMYREIIEVQRRVYGPDDRITLTVMSNLAGALADSGSRSPEIVDLNQKVLEARRRVLGPDHPDTMQSMNNLGIALTVQHRTAEADALLKETLELRKRVLGPEHPETLGTMGALADVYEQEHRYSEDEALRRQAFAIQLRILGPEHIDTISSMVGLAGVLELQKRYANAEPLYRQALASENRVFPADHPIVLQTKQNFAELLLMQNRLPEAHSLMDGILEANRRVFGQDHPITIQGMFVLGKILSGEHRLEESEKLLREARELATRVLRLDNPGAQQVILELADVLAAQGKRDEAIAAIQELVDHGLDPSVEPPLAEDPDLKSLHGDPRFTALVAKAQRSASQH